MSDAAVSPAVNEDEAALAMPLAADPCSRLLRLVRKANRTPLADFIVTRKQRRAIPLIGDPDPDLLWRLDMFVHGRRA
ncbi:DUF269 domain-containing protein [Mesorhizobium sp. M0184]|uniref:DUF269 domain-containing protein n=1 Tax=Mesorhizobium sp. M0184 TaxID=2956906 RepID=UPI00333C4847